MFDVNINAEKNSLISMLFINTIYRWMDDLLPPKCSNRMKGKIHLCSHIVDSLVWPRFFFQNTFRLIIDIESGSEVNFCNVP